MLREIMTYSKYNWCLSYTSPGQLHPSSQSSSQHCPSRIGYQMWIIKCQRDHQCPIINMSHNLYQGTSVIRYTMKRHIITVWTFHNNRPDIFILDKSIKEAYVIDVAIPNSHNLCSTMTRKLQQCTVLKEELIRKWQLKTACVIPLVLPTKGIIPNKLHKSLKLLVSTLRYIF